MRFEWDEKKRRINLERHDLDFEDAPHVFTEDAYVVEDTRENYGESRYLLMGLLYSRVIVIAFTKREDDVIRIFSMRKATKREQQDYVKKQFKRT